MPTRSERERMLAGELYRARDPEIQADLAATAAWLNRYNASSALPLSERRQLLLERLGQVGEGTEVRPPFFCDYGFNIRLGAGVFLNFNCVILDVAEVTIGDGTLVGPAVQIYAADHPRDPAQRRAGLEADLFKSGGMSGSAGEPSSYQASALAMTPSWGPGASSRATCRAARPFLAIPPAHDLVCKVRNRSR
jgi:hypothetical protein